MPTALTPTQTPVSTQSEVISLIFGHWRSTLKGLLGAAGAIITAVIALPPTASRWVIALAIIYALLQFISKDAGTQNVIAPDGKTAAVPAYENPVDKSLTPVPEAGPENPTRNPETTK